MKEDELGGSCSTCGGEERFIPGFLCGKLKEIVYSKDISVDGK